MANPTPIKKTSQAVFSTREVKVTTRIGEVKVQEIQISKAKVATKVKVRFTPAKIGQILHPYGSIQPAASFPY